MRKILVCQHVPYEILGTLNPLLKEAGFRIRYINFGRDPLATPSVDGYYGLIILGGPMCVDQTKDHPFLSHEIKMIQEAFYHNIPVLGICLGAQLIAKTLGAKVSPNKEKEIGWYDISLTEAGKKDKLLCHLAETEKIFQWHGDAFEMPKDAVHLASSPTCEGQAFRFGDKVYAFQFHLEVDEAMILRWLKVSPHLKELSALRGKIDPEVIRQETHLYIEKSKKLSERIFQEFIKLFGVEKKKQILSSR